jgi:hypothetical protein
MPPSTCTFERAWEHVTVTLHHVDGSVQVVVEYSDGITCSCHSLSPDEALDYQQQLESSLSAAGWVREEPITAMKSRANTTETGQSCRRPVGYRTGEPGAGANHSLLSGAEALLGRICLPAAEEFGPLLRDKVGGWRQANVAATLAKAEERLKAAAEEGRHAPPRLILESLAR